VKDNLVKNIIYTFLEKTFQIVSGFFSSFIIIRILEREDYGIIGIVAGFYALLNVFNFSYESIILKEHKKLEEDKSNELSHFLAFSVMKFVLFFLVSVGLAVFLNSKYQNVDFLYAIGSIFLVISIDFLPAPLVFYLTSKFKHEIVSKVAFVRYFFNVVFLIGLYFFPNLQFIFLKDLFIFVLVLFSWMYIIKFHLRLKTSILKNIVRFDREKFVRNVTDFSLWSHLISCVTFFIYRADTVFLSFFSPLKTIGNYNVALSCGNFANLAPSILGFQNSVAISNISESHDIERVSSSFTRISIISSLLMLIGLFVFGEILLQLITGNNDVSEILFYTKSIVIGLLIVKSLASPMVSVINMKGDVKSLFFKVNVPVLFVTAISYYLSSKYFGARGIALANIANSLLWVILVYLEFSKMKIKLNLTSGYREDFVKLYGVIRSKIC